MQIPSFLFEKLSSLLGEGGVITDDSRLTPYLTETRGLFHSQAQAVLLPRSTREVSEILRLLAPFGVSIVPLGGNTGLVGGGVAQGGVILSLQKMNKVAVPQKLNATIEVEAGAIVADVQRVAAEAGLLFPLSLASEGSCTIGGTIATNAGGMNVLRYGNMRALVLGLEAVLADGSIYSALTHLTKDNAGYDLKQLFIGSEGTLGIVTRAVLRLFPARPVHQVAFVGVASPQALLDLLGLLRATMDEYLTTFEILPRFGLELVLRHAPSSRDPLPSPHAWYGLIELSAPGNIADLATNFTKILEQAHQEGKIADAALAMNEKQAQAFRALRERLPECQTREGGSIKHDVSVPIHAIADFLSEAEDLCRAALLGLRPCPFGHIGDGNIHFNLTQPQEMDKNTFLAEWPRFNRLVHDVVHKYHGSIAAEHGVGLLKRAELARYKGEVPLALMRKVKQALDPQNLLNPDKVIPPE